jgi:hypothetical protein
MFVGIGFQKFHGQKGWNKDYVRWFAFIYGKFLCDVATLIEHATIHPALPSQWTTLRHIAIGDQYVPLSRIETPSNPKKEQLRNHSNWFDHDKSRSAKSMQTTVCGGMPKYRDRKPCREEKINPVEDSDLSIETESLILRLS